MSQRKKPTHRRDRSRQTPRPWGFRSRLDTLRLEDRTVPATFTANSAGSIVINDPAQAGQVGQATPYPSTINVAGLTGVVTHLRVTLNNLTHDSVNDLDIMLVAPDGTHMYLMSDNGGQNAVIGVSPAFDSTATTEIGTGAVTTGIFAPSNVNEGDPDTIPGAPATPAVTVMGLGGFHGINPNGAWELRICDDTAIATGSMANWTLTFDYRLNAAPVAVNDSYTLTEETTLTVGSRAQGVLGNDTDADAGDTAALTAVLVTPPRFGTFTFNGANGTFTYTPDPNFDGQDSFTYRATDGIVYGNVGTAVLNVTNTADPVVATADQYTFQTGTTSVVPASRGVLANDHDPDGGFHTRVIQTWENLTLVPWNTGTTASGDGTDWAPLLPDGWVRNNTTTPPPALPTSPGAEAFGWHAMDADSWNLQQGDQDRSQFLLGGIGQHGTVMVVDPDMYDDFVDIGDVSVGQVFNVYLLAPAVPILGTLPGSLQLEFDSSFRPEAIQTGLLDVSYDNGATWTNLLTLNGANPGSTNEHRTFNPTPPAMAQYAIFRFGMINAGNNWWWAIDNVTVKVDRTNPVGANLTATLGSNVTHGTLALNPNGGFSYTPTAGYTGPDSFTYTVSDGTTTSGPVTVSITVVPNVATPVANPDTYSVKQDTALSASGLDVGPIEYVSLGFAGVLNNDTDADVSGTNAGLTAVLGVGPTHGTLTLNADGTFLYTPVAGYFGPDSFTYRASDGVQQSALATVSIAVVQSNLNPPVAQPDSYAVNNNSTLTVNAPGVVGNDTDGDNNPVTAQMLIGPKYGTLNLTSTGSFTYTPITNFNGTDTFVYRAFDGAFTSAPATVTITVNAVNTAATAVNDTYTTTQGAPLTVTAANGVLRNDRDDGPTTQLFFEDFNGLTLGPWNTGTTTTGDGTDWTDSIPAGWARTVSGATPAPPVGTAPGAEFYGWHAQDVDSWVAYGGGVRDTFTRAGVGTHNTMLVADGDLYDNFFKIWTPHMETAIVTPAIPLGAIVPNSLTVDFDSSYRPLRNNRCWVDVSYDGGTTWTTILFLNRDNSGNNNSAIRQNEHQAVNAGNPAGATSAQFRFRFKAGDEFWWAIDNVRAYGNTAYSGANVTAGGVTQPAHGSVVLNTNGSFTYTPAAGYSGPDSFTYTVNDGVNTSAPATVSLTVQPTNTPPAANVDAYATPAGTPLVVAAPGVLANDTDAQNSPQVTLFSENFDSLPLVPWNAGTGPAARPGDGTDWTDALPTGWVRDNTTTLVPTSPTAAGAEFYGWHIVDVDAWLAQQGDQERSRFTLGGAGDNGSVLVADSDLYDDFGAGTTGANPLHTLLTTPSVSLTGAVPGSLTLEFDNSFRPEAAGDPQVAQADVSYDGGTTWINLLNMNGNNTTGLTRVNEHVVLNANNPAGATSAKFRFNYTGDNNWWWAIDNVAVKVNNTVNPPLTVTGSTQPLHGTVTVNPNGSFTYNPTAGFNGLDSFTYTASDGTLSSTGTAYVLVGSPPIGFQVNDGSAQRSLVQSLTVAINGLATYPVSPAAAFQLAGPGGNVGLVATSQYVGGMTLVNMTFTGAGIVNRSLADGRYILTASANQITVNGAALDGDGNGTPGGDYVFGDDLVNERLFRLFADTTGNGLVDLADLADFRSTFNKTAADAGFLSLVDYDGNQVVDLADLGEFRSRFNINLYP